MADRRVLMVAFHFPPLAGSSGIQRTLRFVQHLPALGWQPLVLTAHPRVYERTAPDLDAEVPAGVPVRRAAALDAARHLAIGGRYPAALARPDRWMSWRYDAVRQGLEMARTYGADALWSTYPIATAHAIGASLQRRTGLPWIADFRDPMAQDGYPQDARTWQAFSRIEQLAAQAATRLCFTTPSAAALYRHRYPDAADRIELLENGYDEPSFAAAAAALGERRALNPGCTTLLHSGTVYPSERDPGALIAALAQLKVSDAAAAQRLRLRFRAAVHDDLLHELAARHGVAELVEVLPPLGYGEALAEMLRADVLLVLQASNCNEQVPAKVYEYLRAGRPIACLSDAAGDTCKVLRDAGIQHHAALDDAPAIAALLRRCASGLTDGFMPQTPAIAAASRQARAVQLAAMLNASVAGR